MHHGHGPRSDPTEYEPLRFPLREIELGSVQGVARGSDPHPLAPKSSAEAAGAGEQLQDDALAWERRRARGCVEIGCWLVQWCEVGL